MQGRPYLGGEDVVVGLPELRVGTVLRESLGERGHQDDLAQCMRGLRGCFLLLPVERSPNMDHFAVESMSAQ
jgi:hypothetical protein